MKRSLLFALLLAAGLLAACAPAASARVPALNSRVTAVPSVAAPTPTDDPALLPTLFPDTNATGEMTRTDQQGIVVVEVTPLNLYTPSDTLKFDVAMNTHAVDLSMDLAKLATLTTDTGITVPASLWDAVPGGHHVSGTLVFPATDDGKPILEGATTLTLTLLDVDVPSRVFEWRLK